MKRCHGIQVRGGALYRQKNEGGRETEMIALPIRVILLAIPFWLTKRKVRIWLIIISLVLYALLLFANAFYYVHWYVFKIAFSHMESIPLSSALNGFFSLGFAAYAVYKLMCGEDKRKYTVVFLFNICACPLKTELFNLYL